MRLAIGLAIALLWATPTLPQTPPDTFKAGIGGYLSSFVVSTSVDSGKIAIQLPASLTGQVVWSVRSFYSPPVEGPVTPELWMADAAFTWGLRTDTNGWPGPPVGDPVSADLKSNPDLRIGGWVETTANWPLSGGDRYWLVGYWQKDAGFIRVGRNQRDPEIPLSIGYADTSAQVWDHWSNSGFMIEVTYGPAGEDTPSGIFDEPARDDNRVSSVVRASVTGSELTIMVPSDVSPIRLQVVNILGQTVVSHTGMAHFGELRVPWSASRPSGVYFCRIQSGTESYTVSFVSVK